jgi:hypothetical protein
MPEIILTEDLNKKKDLLRGKKRDWPRSTISQVSASLGRTDWYEMAEAVEERQAQRSVKRKRKEE